MSRSRKRTPVSPNACVLSEKDDKARANRRFRRVTRERIRADSDPGCPVRAVLPILAGYCPTAPLSSPSTD